MLEEKSNAASTQVKSDRLESWKEIAAYTKRDVRTVQRWEKKEGLPVHRHLHDKLGSVYAYKSELDRWWKERAPNIQDEAQLDLVSSNASSEGGTRTNVVVQEITGQVIVPTPPAKSRGRLWIALSIALIAIAAILIYLLKKPPDGYVQPGLAIVVFPFNNLSADPSQDYFTDGITDEITAQLGLVSPEQLMVISLGPTTSTQEDLVRLAESLKADYFLRGGIRRDLNRVVIRTQLIRASDNVETWSETYERDLQNIIQLQIDVAHSIASEISELKLVVADHSRIESRRSIKPEAYEAYLKGRYFWHKRDPEDLMKGLHYFEESVRIDPNYPQAYSGIADTYTLLGALGIDAVAPGKVRMQAIAAAERAVALDDSLGEAHASLANARMVFDWNWSGADREFRKAISLNPDYPEGHHWYAHFLMESGRMEESRKEFQKARELDPLNLPIATGVARELYLERKYDDAIRQCKLVLDMQPGFVEASLLLTVSYQQKSMFDEALREIMHAQQILTSSEHANQPDAALEVPVVLSLLGRTYALSGNRVEAEDQIRKLESLSHSRYVPSFYFAVVYLGLGNEDQAFNWLDKAVEERSEAMLFLKTEPGYDTVRSDPRYIALRKRIGLP